MVNITIDGQKLQVPEGVTILEAARTANINIPTLCYHEDQKIKSVCRICAVEVEGQRLLQAACSYPVAEGMVVRTSTPVSYTHLIGFDEGFQFIKIYFNYYVGIYAFDLQSIFKRLSKKDWEKCCNYAIEFLKGNKN